MKTTRRRFWAAVMTMIMALALVGCGGEPASDTTDEIEDGGAETSSSGYAGEEYTLKLAHHLADTHIGAMMCERFKEEVESLTDGKITIDIYGNGQLGTLSENTEALRMGTVDLAMTDFGNLANVYPKASIFNSPYIFNDYNHIFAFLDSEGFDELASEVEEATSVKILVPVADGFRKIFSKEQINGLADLKGVKVRVPDTQVYVDTIAALGAAPTVVPWGEVYTALQTGVVTAYENTYNGCYSNALYEQATYCLDTCHLTADVSLGVSHDSWENLDADAQAAINAAADVAAQYARELLVETDEADKQKCIDAGVVITECDIEEFRAAVAPVWDKYKNEVEGGAELIEYIQNLTY